MLYSVTRALSAGGLPLAALCAGWIHLAQAAPYIPADPDQVMQQLPVEVSTLPDGWAKVARNDPVAASLYASRMLSAARSTGDPRYFGYARTSLEPWWVASAVPEQLILQRADLKQHIHDFEGALKELQKLQASSSFSTDARLMEAHIHTAQGNYSAAAVACQQLTLAAPEHALLCVSRVKGFTGQKDQARSILNTLLARQLPDSLLHEAHLTLGEIDHLEGKLDEAKAHYLGALDIQGNNPYTLASLGQLMLLQQDFHGMLAVLPEDSLNISSQVLRTIAAKALSQRHAENQISTLEERFLNDDTLRTGRDYGVFMLHIKGDQEAAYAIARENWKRQKEPADLHLLVDCAVQQNDIGQLRQIQSWISSHGLSDQLINQKIDVALL